MGRHLYLPTRTRFPHVASFVIISSSLVDYKVELIVLRADGMPVPSMTRLHLSLCMELQESHELGE